MELGSSTLATHSGRIPMTLVTTATFLLARNIVTIQGNRKYNSDKNMLTRYEMQYQDLV